MSKKRRQIGQQNSWPFVEGRCEMLFGDKRFHMNADNGTLNILFDLSDPVQMHEHRVLVHALLDAGVPHETDAKAEPMEGTFILAPKGKLQLSIDKDMATPDELNDAIQPIFNFSQHTGKNERRYKFDPAIRLLKKLTDRDWFRRVPSEYTSDPLYEPVQQTPNLTEEQRYEQEQVLAEAFLPSWRKPHVLVNEWVGEQKRIEDAKGSSAITALHSGLVLMDDDIMEKKHRKSAATDEEFTKRIRRAFDIER